MSQGAGDSSIVEIRSIRRGAAGAALLVLAIWGCGGEEPEERSGGRRLDAVLSDSAERTAPRRIGNLPPEIDDVSFEPARPGAGQAVRAVVEARDPEGDALRLSYSWSVNGEPVEGSRDIARLSNTRRGDRIEVSVEASDGDATSPSFEAVTSVANRPPRLLGIQIEPAGRITAGGEVEVTAQGVDPDGDEVSFRYRWWINGVSADEEGPRLSTRSLRRGDTLRVSVVATDGRDESAPIESPEMTVENGAPRILSAPGGAGPDGVFRYRVQAEDPEGDRNLRFSLGRAPRGMTVSKLGGEIEWRPRADQNGDFPVEIVVEDSYGASSVQRFELTIDRRGG